MAVFWVVVPISQADVYRHFRGAYCLHYQDEELSFYQTTYVVLKPRRQ
jgi:hypothetical protein